MVRKKLLDFRFRVTNMDNMSPKMFIKTTSTMEILMVNQSAFKKLLLWNSSI